MNDDVIISVSHSEPTPEVDKPIIPYAKRVAEESKRIPYEKPREIDPRDLALELDRKLTGGDGNGSDSRDSNGDAERTGDGDSPVPVDGAADNGAPGYAGRGGSGVREGDEGVEGEDGAVQAGTDLDRGSPTPAAGEKVEGDVIPEDIDLKTLGQILINCKEIMENMAKLWLVTAREYWINDSIMRRLSDFNDSHRSKPDPNLTKEQLKEFDHLNGLDHLTMEDVVNIFGKIHPCIKPTIEETREVIKEVANTFFDYAVAKREYVQMNSAYLQYVEEQEENEAERYEKMIAEETDPVKKKALEKSLQHYSWLKYLGFLGEPLSDIHLQRIKTGLVDPKKAEYWLRRSSEKLGQLKADPQFIMSLYHFEEKNLPEKYWKLNNCLLIHFMTICISADMHDPRSEYRNMARCFFIGIHSLWRGLLNEKGRETVMNNIMAFEDQLLDVIETNPEGETISPSTFN